MPDDNGPIVQDTLAPGQLPQQISTPVSVVPQGQGSRVGDFLSAISKLAPQTSQALQSAQSLDQQQGDAAAEAARMKALSASPQELRQEIASGNYFGMAHQRAQTALRVMDATNRAFDVSSQLDAIEKSGQLNTADPTKVLASTVQPAADGITDPLAQRAFTKTLQPVIDKFRLASQSAAVSQDMATRQAKLLQYSIGLHSQIDQDHAQDAEQDGGQPVDAETSVAAHKRAMFQTADYAKNDLLLPPDAIAKVFGQTAQHFAYSGNQNVLSALGSYDRNGTPLSASYGPQWDAWTKQAEAAADKTSKDAANNAVDSLSAEAIRADGKPQDFNAKVDAALAANPKDFPEAKAEHLKAVYAQNVLAKQQAATQALAQQQTGQYQRDYVERGTNALMSGNGWQLPEKAQFQSADGETHTYARKDYLQSMYARAEALTDDMAQREGWTPEQTELAKAKLYSANGDVRPVYQQSFDDLFAGSKAGVPPSANIQGRLAQLDMLRTQDPNQYANLAGTGRDGKMQETWLAAWRSAREFGADPERALAIANQRVFNPSATDRMNAKETAGKIDDVLAKWTGGRVLGPFGQALFGIGGLGVAMGPIARAKAADAVNLQVAAGTADKDIVDRATQALQQSHLIVNGVPVHMNIPGVGEPSVAAEYLVDGAKFFQDQHPQLKDQTYTLAFADSPNSAGKYIVVRTDTGERISEKDISGADLKDYVIAWRSHNAVKEREDAAASDRLNSALRETGSAGP